MPRIQKKLYILLYENRKYQSKMCTNSLEYVTKNLHYKKDLQRDQIRRYLEHRGTDTGQEQDEDYNLGAEVHPTTLCTTAPSHWTTGPLEREGGAESRALEFKTQSMLMSNA